MNGRVVVMTPVPGKPFAYTSEFEDGTTVVDRIVEAFNAGNVTKK